MFKIQISNPKVEDIKSEIYFEFSDFIQDIFSDDNEELIMNWNRIRIPISYKYDISIILLDFLHLINSINSADKSNVKICFGSNSFFAVWICEWDDNNIKTISNWNQVSGFVTNLLNDKNELIINKLEFLNEIYKIIFFISDLIETKKIIIREQSEISILEKVLFDYNTKIKS